MILQIPIPKGLEVRLVGSQMTLIGPNGTMNFQGSYVDYSMSLDRGHIVLSPKENSDSQISFNEGKIIEQLIEGVIR